MKCPNCGREVQDKYNFCPGCRTNLKNVAMPQTFNVAEKFNNPVSFKNDESRQQSPTQVPCNNKPLSIVKNKAIWNIMPGEVCRHINEEEFTEYKGVRGVIIGPGVTAFVVVDGEIVKQFSTGNYSFSTDSIEQELKDIELERQAKLYDATKEPGFIGRMLNKGRDFLSRIIKSIDKPLTKNEKVRNVNDNYDKKVDEAIEIILRGKTVSVYLMLEREFPALFGSRPTSDGTVGFLPMRIAAKNGDTQVGINLSLRINDPMTFIVQHMAGKKSMRLEELQRMVMPCLAPVMRQISPKYIIDEYGVPFELINEVKDQIPQINSHLRGFEICNFIDITCNTDDFERFRQLSKEMYKSERELDYLRRTNDFKNRLVDVENEQKLNEAKSDFEMMKALEEINKDNILYKEELNNFYRLVSRQHRIAVAKDDMEVEKALDDIEKTHLLNQEEMDQLRLDLETRKIERENVADAVRFESSANTARQRMKLETELLIDRDRSIQTREASQFQIYLQRKEQESQSLDINEELYGKTYAAQRRRLLDKLEYDNIARQDKLKQELEDAEHAKELTRTAIDTQKLRDDYKDDRWNAELEKEKKIFDTKIEQSIQAKMVDITVEDKAEELRLKNIAAKSKLAMDNLKQLNDMDEAQKSADWQREQQTKDNDLRRNDFAQDKEVERLLKVQDAVHKQNLDILDANQKSKAQDYTHEEAMADKANEVAMHKDDNITKVELVKVDAQKYTHDQENEYLRKRDADREEAIRKREAELKEMQEKEEAKRRYEDLAKAEKEKEALAREDRRHREDADRNERLMMAMMNAVSGNAQTNMQNMQSVYERNSDRLMQMGTYQVDEKVANERRRNDDLREMKDEYRNQAYHAQERLDATQQQGLNYTARVNMVQSKYESVQASAPTGGTTASSPASKTPKQTICPECHTEVFPNDEFCPNCGTELNLK